MVPLGGGQPGLLVGRRKASRPCLWVVAWVGARWLCVPQRPAMSQQTELRTSARCPQDPARLCQEESLIRTVGDPQGVRAAKRELPTWPSRMVSLAGPALRPAAGPRPSPT